MEPIIYAKRRVVINGGHSDDPDTPQIDEPGAVVEGIVEAEINMAIRDELVPLLRGAGFEVFAVPDELRLRPSIDWANKQVKYLNDGFDLSLHFNSSRNTSVRGTEVYYYKDDKTSREMAAILSRNVAKALGTIDRGAKSDTTTRFKRLGWIRNTNGWAILLEVEYMSSIEGMRAVRAPGMYRKIAEAIVASMKEIYGIEEEPEPEISGTETMMERLMKELAKLLKAFELWKGRNVQPT